MSDLVQRLRIKAGMIEMGEMIAWGSDSALMREAAVRLEALQAECEKLRNDAARWREIRKGGDSVRVVFTDWDAMKDYVLSNEEADAAIDAAMEPQK